MMKIFVYIVLSIAILYVSSASAAVTYKSYVDLDYGFYKVIGIGTNPANDTEKESTYFTQTNYVNKSLTINVSDTVVWANYDIKDWPLTIISQQGLWNEKDSYLKWNYRKFNYTFTEPGTYEIYIKENKKSHQTIIVNPIDTPVRVVGIITNPEPTETPFQTPIMTQIPIIQTPKATSAVASPGFGFITVIMTILPALYLLRK